MAEYSNEPSFGEHGEPCAYCKAPLAHDQRYCLHCGERRAEARLPFMEILAGVTSLKDREGVPGAGGALVPAETVHEHVEEPTPKWMAPLLAAAAVATLAIVLAVGIMIGGDDQKVASTPPVVVGGGPGGGSGNQLAATTEFVSDWPPDLEGWTVQLQKLPTDSTDVAAISAAKTAAEGKGATKVGALRSDDFSSLEAGSYVIYSGQFDDKKGATAALKGIQKDFPGAKVIQVAGSKGGSASQKEDPDALSGKKEKATVSRSQLNDLERTAPEDYSKRSAKLPDKTVIPGKPPPTDNRAPGGGSGGGVSIP
ncbi:MAG: hypothetical protein ACR2ML_12475 [Solirubrobacteraceae bacterium]